MADNKMLIDATHPEETRVVVLRGGRVEEFDYESAARKLLRGNIYLAKVTRVEPALQAAFVDYGGNRHGFLAFNEIHPDYYQIPMADRIALIEEEVAAAAAHDDDLYDADDHDDASSDLPRGVSSQNGNADFDNDHAEGHDDDATDEADSAETGDADLQTAASSDHAANDDDAHGGNPAPDQDTANDNPDETAGENAVAENTPEEEASAPTVAKAATLADPLLREDLPEADDLGEPGEDEISDAETDDQSASADATDEKATAEIDNPSSDDELAREEMADANAPGDDDAPHEVGLVEKQGVEDVTPDENSETNGSITVDEVGTEDALEEVPFRPRRSRRSYKIQEVIKRRQILLIQVVKEERGNKGAALTTYLSLAGRYTVLMPNTARGGGVSRKISSPQDRKRMKGIAGELDVPEGMGLIIRTAGASRTKQEIRRDFEYLLRMWESVRELTLESTAPSLVYEEGDLIKRSIRDLYDKDVDEVIVAGETAHKEAKSFMKMLMPSHARNVTLYKAPEPLFTRYQIERQLNAMFSPQVTLRSGGYLVINQTEALVAIDVNSGRSTREFSIEETALHTNLEAAEEAARQLKLRDLAGLIVIDFIDMDEKRNNRAVERRLKDVLRNDRARIQVGRISHFGLLEMSRQRMRTGVLEGSTSPCPHCSGTGTIRSTESVALAVLRGLEDAVMAGARTPLIATAPEAVALYILNSKRQFVDNMELRLGHPILIQISNTLVGANFKIEKGSAAAFGNGGRARRSVVNMDWSFTDERNQDDGGSRPQAPGRTDDSSGDDSDQPRKRRRRRRGRRGRDDGGSTSFDDANTTPRPDGGSSSDDGENGDQTAAFEQSEHTDRTQDGGLEGGENSSRQREAGDSDADGENTRRRRRRGRRGGRRNRERREQQAQRESGVRENDASNEQDQNHTATGENGNAHGSPSDGNSFAEDLATSSLGITGDVARSGDTDDTSPPGLGPQPGDRDETGEQDDTASTGAADVDAADIGLADNDDTGDRDNRKKRNPRRRRERRPSKTAEADATSQDQAADPSGIAQSPGEPETQPMEPAHSKSDDAPANTNRRSSNNTPTDTPIEIQSIRFGGSGSDAGGADDTQTPEAPSKTRSRTGWWQRRLSGDD